ncbi:Nuclear pore complex protein nup50a [Thalictrum thalictroides]|uniref:Nuclear pore complex protein nup50a n=1 Tax=Thalictrum thalictroides TaxID=46969 RepID=A0A7J6XD32_THATH|nr:Nuclear pore complex protein nup50a [Thalictrum thalictroides]
MADAENALAPSKKRAAGREISRDDPGLDDEEGADDAEIGTFKKASEEVLATRRIVKVRRQQTPASASSNPFAKISFVPPPTEPTAKGPEDTAEAESDADKSVSLEVDDNVEGDTGTEKSPSVTEANEKDKTDEQKSEFENKETSESVGEETKVIDNDKKKLAEGEGERNEAKKDDGHGDASPSAATASLNSFQQLSSNQNAFTGIAGTGFSSSTFSFGSLSKDGSPFSAGSGSLFGLKNDNSTFPSFNFNNSKNGGSSIFGSAGASDATKSEGTGLPSMQEVPVETGEENEKAVFTAEAALFEYLDGAWKERGKGELKVNIATTGVEKARLVMRARGNYRLVLNAALFPDMKLTNMEKRGITFACMNSTGEGKDGLTTFALKFKDIYVVEEFRTAVTLHKGKGSTALKTPENSPKASDD